MSVALRLGIQHYSQSEGTAAIGEKQTIVIPGHRAAMSPEARRTHRKFGPWFAASVPRGCNDETYPS
jgi:hypothetical protein